MSNKWIGVVASALLLAPMAARADIINGSFSGTLTGDVNNDTVFNSSGADLAGDAITGTFSYNTALLSQSISAGVNTATGSPGAVTVTITIGSASYTFTDQSSSSVVIEGDSSYSQFDLSNADYVGVHTDTFTLQLSDTTQFAFGGADLTQPLSIGDPTYQTNSFSIQDAGGAGASGGFTITSLISSDISSSVPEPASMAVLAMGLIGLAGVRARKARAG